MRRHCTKGQRTGRRGKERMVLRIIVVLGKAPNQRSTKSRCERIQTGVLTPGTSALTKLSPERATECITCLISNCLYLCRPFGTFHVVAQLPGVLRFAQAQAESTPVCILSSLRDFGQAPMSCFCQENRIIGA